MEVTRFFGFDHFAGDIPHLTFDAAAPNGAEHGAVLADQQLGALKTRDGAAYLDDGRVEDARKTFNQIQAKKSEVETKAREAADAARKASTAATLALFISLLIGAFIASYAAIIGGRQRDD